MDFSLFTSEELIALCRNDLKDNNIENALYKIKVALTKDDFPTEGNSLAGRIYAQLGLFETAQAFYEAYLQAHPDSVTENFELGMMHFETNRIDAALDIWKDVLNKAPAHPPGLFFCGLAQAQKGDLLEAKDLLEKLISATPEDNLYYGKAEKLLRDINTAAIKTSESPSQYQ